MKIIYLENLVKVYNKWNRKSIKALDDVTFEVEKGKIFALLGPNGAGKSTLIKIIVGLLHPTSGRVYINNSPVNFSGANGSIGYLPEYFRVPKYFTPQSLLEYLGQLSGLKNRVLEKKITEVLEMVNLTEHRFKKVKSFSKGMIQRLGIAQAILHDPGLLILDEPTDGVDPMGRKAIRDLFVKLRDQGKTIFLNSHLLSEVELIADEIVILNKGKVVGKGSLVELLPATQQFEIFLSLNPELERENWIVYKVGEGYKVVVTGSRQLQELIGLLESKKIQIVTIKPVQASLEDVFFSYINSVDGL